jgi:hypothetical protein
MKYAARFSPRPCRAALFAGAVAALFSASAFAQQAPYFTPGNLVVAVSGCGVFAGSCVSVPNGTGNGTGNSSIGGYGDNQASPLTLFQFAPAGTSSATYVNSLVLPQSVTGANFPVSAEYGSSSEDTLQLSGDGRYLTIMGYGVDVASFNANPGNYGSAPSFALAQSGSLTNAGYTAVPRVVALIDAFGNVNSSTALYNIFNTNNPRSAFTAAGSSVYVSGQGSGSDATGGVFYSPLGAPNTAPTPITGLDTTTNSVSQDTRDVQIVNNTLYVSVDSKGGKNSARSYIGTLGAAGTPPTSTVGGPVMLAGYGNTQGTGKYTITSGANGNGNGLNSGVQINLSPVNYFFANASTLYVADSGFPKNDSTVSSGSSIGDGGLQKWTNSKTDGSGTWTLIYTLHQGLPLVANTSAAGTTGLYGLTGVVSGGNVQLFATNYVINDLDPTFLYGITDTLAYTSASQAASESFTQLAAAPSDSNFKGVAFTPTAPPPAATPANLIFTNSLSGSAANGYSVKLTIANSGGTAATGVTLTSVKIGSTLASPLPDAVGTVAAGGSAQATLTVPGSAGADGAASTVSVSGTYDGGSFTSTVRVKLP